MSPKRKVRASELAGRNGNSHWRYLILLIIVGGLFLYFMIKWTGDKDYDRFAAAKQYSDYYKDFFVVKCFYNGENCGDRCDYFGQNCKKVYLPQCAVAGHCPQNGYDMGLTENQQCTCDGVVTSNVSVEVDDGNGGTTTEKHSFCCPANHTYTNGGCTLL